MRIALPAALAALLAALSPPLPALAQTTPAETTPAETTVAQTTLAQLAIEDTAGEATAGEAATGAALTDTDVSLLTPVLLDPNDPANTRVGALDYLTGYRIQLDKPQFGGLSDLCVYADAEAGTRLVAIGDRGIEATIGFTGTPDALGEVAIVALFALRSPDGNRLLDKVSGDAEALLCEGPLRRYVGFEHQHRIWLYEEGGSVTAIPIPPAARMLPPNEGIEGIARLADGNLLLVAEGGGDAQKGPAWIGTGSGAGDWAELTLRRSEGYVPTGLAALPNGDVLLLERFFTEATGPAARISLLRAVEIRAGAEIRPREIARIEPPLTVDNFEGIAVAPAADGGTLVFLLSDDNFNPWQRTLLLVFRLEL
jgi:hypothetical protein